MTSLSEISGFVIYTTTFLLPIVNPIGCAPLFLEFTGHYSKKVRRKIALLVAINCFCLMSGLLLLGGIVLGFFGISVAEVEVAGGALLMYTAWGMLNTKKLVNEEEEEDVETQKSGLAFFPLTMPITIGPGVWAMIISLDAKIATTKGWFAFFDRTSAIIGIFIISLLVLITYRYAGVIFKYLGTIGTNVITKISAFIIIALGFHIAWGGMTTLILDLIKKIPA